MRVMIIAPHPDDEVLGCGGTIARLSQEGYEIHVLIVTTAYTPDWSEEFIKNRDDEIKKAHRILGVKKTHFLNYPTVKLDIIPRKELNEKITQIVHQVKPDIVFIPHIGDLHHDHRIIFESSLVALRPIKHTVAKILSYEVLSETEWGYEFSVFKPNIYYDITETFEKKLEAMITYMSELREFPHPRSIDAIEALAKKRGSEIGVKYAEAFHLIREIILQGDQAMANKRFREWDYPKIEHGKLTKWNWMVQYPEGLKLGKYTDIGAFTYINAKYGVIIEDYVQIGSHCSIYSESTIDGKKGQVIIKRNARIGSHSVIMPGVTIGENAIVGAFSFVNKDIPDNTVAFGIPVKIIRKLTEGEIKKLLEEIE